MAGGHKGKQGRKPKASTIIERQRGQTALTSAARRVPPAPAHLTDVAKAEWKRMGKLLKDVGLLTNMDTVALEVYSTAHAEYLEAEAMLQGPMGFCPNCDPRVEREVPGSALLAGYKPCMAPFHPLPEFGMVIRRKQGSVGPSPYVAISKQARQDIKHFLGEFGMTPASRSRIPRDTTPERPPRRAPEPNGKGGAPVDPRDVLKLAIEAGKN